MEIRSGGEFFDPFFEEPMNGADDGVASFEELLAQLQEADHTYDLVVSLNLFEEVCGARLTYSFITPGGVTADLPPGWLERWRHARIPPA